MKTVFELLDFTNWRLFLFNLDDDTNKSLAESQRVHLLLQFMEHLEKQLYNAYEGCAVAMVNPPKVRW